MGRWEKIQEELIKKAVHGEKSDIIQEDISRGRIYGTTYYKKGTKPVKGVLLIHGISGNRHGMAILGQRLASYGFFCLAIDLPTHFVNTTNFSVGELSETITEGVLLLKNTFSMKRVAVVGHSIGAIGALFSSAGYTIKIEKALYTLWQTLVELLEKQAKLIQAKGPEAKEVLQINTQIEALYTQLKQLILESLKKGMQEHAEVPCYILLAPPLNCKSAIPGMSILRQLPQKWAKTIFEAIFHKPAVKQIYKEGNPVGYVPEDKEGYVYWQFFKIPDSKEFLTYFMSMKEPADFLTLVEQIVKFRHKDNMVSFFQYYQKKYLLAKPKLFIYGSGDLYLKPFLPFQKKRIEQFYESCGNAEIYHGNFTHIMMDNPSQQMTAIAFKNEEVTKRIIQFLDANL